MKNIITLTLLILCMYSCKQKTDAVLQNTPVAITINSPIEGQTFHNGDTVLISADIKYDGELHGYEVKITDTVSGFILYDDAQHVHDDHFTINDKWVCSATKKLYVKMQLIASKDHEGNEDEKTVSFQCEP